MDIQDSILDLVGDTPMVYLDALRPEGGARIAAKLEMFNPGYSVKDRIGVALIRSGEESGKLQPGGTIVEPTSGNTGLGLAMAASLMGYKMVCTLPDKVPQAKQDLLRAYGAEVIVCPTEVAADDPKSYYKVAEKMADEGAFLPYQYYNQANPEAHVKTTGPEIWRQTDGKITHFVAGVGTGGTISGIGRYLHQQNKDAKVIGVDTEGSVYEHYFHHRELPPEEEIHQYLIQGIGEDLLPDTVWWDEIDDVITVSDADAFAAQARMVRKCAVFSGSSAGAAVAGAIRVAAEADPDDLVITLLPDAGERYIASFNPDWLKEHGLDEAAAILEGNAE